MPTRDTKKSRAPSNYNFNNLGNQPARGMGITGLTDFENF